MHMMTRLGTGRSCRGHPSEHLHVYANPCMSAQLVVCQVPMIMNDLVLMTNKNVFAPGTPPLCYRAPAEYGGYC